MSIVAIILFGSSMLVAEQCTGEFEHSTAGGYAMLQCKDVRKQVYTMPPVRRGIEDISINGTAYNRCTLQQVNGYSDRGRDTVLFYHCPG